MKLGVPYAYRRQEDSYSSWDKREEDNLDIIYKVASPLVQASSPPQPNRGKSVYAVYHQESSSKMEFRDIKEGQVSTTFPSRLPLLHSERDDRVLPEDYSGCPILVPNQSAYRLVGLNFSGDNDDAGAGASAGAATGAGAEAGAKAGAGANSDAGVRAGQVLMLVLMLLLVLVRSLVQG